MRRYYFACGRNRDAEPDDSIAVDAPNARAALHAALRAHPEVTADQLTLILVGAAAARPEAQ